MPPKLGLSGNTDSWSAQSKHHSASRLDSRTDIAQRAAVVQQGSPARSCGDLTRVSAPAQGPCNTSPSGMAQPAKDGYEAAPLLNQAEAGVQTPEWQPEQPAPRTWHGSLFACCGPSCDALGWTTCLVTHYLPAVTFGINSRKAHGKSALRAGLLFATLMFLSWAHYAAQMSLVDGDCLADFMPPPDRSSPRRMGPAFVEADGSIHRWAAKPFGRPMDAGKLGSPRCMRLMQTCALLNIATLMYGTALLVYGAMMRTSMRERFGIQGSRCGDLFAWLCCAPCSMCQEARTLAVNNVEHGQWHGATPGLPVVYFAAAETQAPSVPVMSADAIKPPKA